MAEGTAARKLGASFDILAPGKRGCPYHLHHAQEEMFVILDGHGTLRVDGEMLPLKTGDVVFIPAGPEYPHQIINTSSAPLKYLSISTMERPEICEYPDSDKFAATGSPESPQAFRHVGRRPDRVDYWDGEPRRPPASTPERAIDESSFARTSSPATTGAWRAGRSGAVHEGRQLTTVSSRLERWLRCASSPG